MSLQPILAPYDLDRHRRGTGAGPEALIANNVLDGLDAATPATIEITNEVWSQIQHCVTVDAAIASEVDRARAARRIPIVFAGNCHSCLGTLAGLGARSSIVWFDAHGDLNTPETTETGYFDGMSLAVALGWAWSSLVRQIPGFSASHDVDAVLVGGRDLDAAERALLERSRVTHYPAPALQQSIAPDFGNVLRSTARPRPAYVHLDLDVLDPSELHANRFNVDGGVSVAWLEAALREVGNHHEIAAVGVTAYDPGYAAPAKAAPIVNRLLRAVLGTTP